MLLFYNDEFLYTILSYLYYLAMEAQKSQKSLYRSENCLSIPSEKQVIVHPIPLIKDATCIQIYENTLYLGSHNSKVFCYQLQSRNSENPPLKLKQQKSFYPHCNIVNLICASKYYLIVIPLLEQQLIRIWNRSTLQILHGFQGHEKQITQIKFLRDKQHIASISYDGTARIWKITQNFQSDTSKLMYKGKYPLLTLEEIDNETIGFGGDDCTIILWNWQKQVRRCRVFAHPGSILLLSYYYPFLISAGGDSKIKIWIIQKFVPDQILKQNNHPLRLRHIDTQSLLNVSCINEIKASFNNHLFYYNLSDKQFLLLDSQGRLFTLMDELTISTNTITLNYAQRIKSMKIWDSMILFVSNKTPQNGEFKIATFKDDSDKPQVQRIFQFEKKGKDNSGQLKALQILETEAEQHFTH